MKIAELEALFELELRNMYDLEESNAIFSLAAEQVLELSPVKLRMQRTVSVTYIHQQKLLSILNDLKIGKPIQHILGEAHFYGSVFKVDASVLIPRPETEELVDWVIEELSKSYPNGSKLLDIGTGSGCIPISIKKYVPTVEVSSMDVSEEALIVARENAAHLNTSILFIHADVLHYQTEEKYDVMVSNPPYIRPVEKAAMHENVLAHEPHLALFVSEENPLIFYKAIADLAIQNLNPNGSLFFEINEYLGEEMVEMLTTKHFIHIELKKDMQGKDRMIKASFSPSV